MLCYRHQVARGGVVVRVVEPVDIRKVRILAAESRRLVVHHLDKALDRAADVHRKNIRRIVAASHKQAVEQILYAHLLARLKPDYRASCAVEQVDSLVARLDFFIEILAVFEHDGGGHYFSQRCGSRLLVRILFENNRVIVEVDEQINLGINRIISAVCQTFLVYRVIISVGRHGAEHRRDKNKTK